ncbi:prolyl 4-hydroxylase alpha-like protein [Medicago truncatula]|uniref:procollagen-proline 4-dioxygenase n=1 Tax=Medicago truncatula TaxID=3880 RepID=G7J5V6_MEDTR|nr:prolyl 4-hydroxylase alpha-like protein [Medicago truncatula]
MVCKVTPNSGQKNSEVETATSLKRTKRKDKNFIDLTERKDENFIDLTERNDKNFIDLTERKDENYIDLTERNAKNFIDCQEGRMKTSLSERKDQWTEVLSSEPRASMYHNFLSKEECEHLINLAKPFMQRSLVVDGVTGQGILNSVRTSSGTFLERGKDKIVQNVERRIADITSIPIENGEGLQIIHYEVGQKFEPHYDYNFNWRITNNGGPRVATVLMYLSDVEEGGETVFPNAKPNFNSVSKYHPGKGLVVKPKMGDALLFWSVKPDGSLDTASLHGGSPVIRGSKWASNKLLHLTEFKV